MAVESSRKRFRPEWAVIIIIIIIAGGLITPAGRRLGRRFFGSLRMQKVHAVNVNLSNFVGPGANRTLQQMVSRMISDKVTVTLSEETQTAATAAEAGELAGFPVQLLAARKDSPEITVAGAHAFTLTVDRSRLEAILKEAGRPDLVVPAAIDGTTVAVKIPRTLRARYGECPGRRSATANIATPTPNSTAYNTCVVLAEGPSPQVNMPSGLDLGQLAEIALEVAGMTPAQARQFLQTVNWKETLGVYIPRFMRSYEMVKVDGTDGTLLDLGGRRGPTYILIWAKNGMVYSLTGYGDSGSAVTLADSLK